MKISVIVPVYGTEKTLEACLDSLLRQDHDDYEILCVNDGSPDGSGKILARYAAEYPDRIFVFDKPNGGLSDARNYGIERAKGDYIAFVDSDDTVRENFLSRMAKEAENGAEIVVCNFFFRNEKGELTFSRTHQKFTGDAKKDYILSEPSAWARLIARDLFRENRFQKGLLYEDLEFSPALVLEAERVAFAEEGLYEYFVRSGSIMNQSSYSPRMLDIFTALSSVKEKFEKKGKAQTYHDEIEALYIEHLLRSAALRFAPFPNGKALLRKIRETMRENFPDWKKNPYLKKRSVAFRLAVFCAGHGWRTMLKLLVRLKEAK